MAKKKILVVEDDEVLRLVEERALRKAGYTTCWTDATNRVFYILHEEDIALVVLDVDAIRKDPNGPVMRGQGLEFLKQLRADERYSKEKLPVVGTTVHMPPEAPSWEPWFLAAGGNTFLEWPNVLDDLVPIVDKLLNGGHEEKCHE